VRSKNLVGASRDLIVSFRDSFENCRDLLIILDPTNGININCHLFPINKAHLFTCSSGLLFFSLYHSKVIKLSLSSFSLDLSGLASVHAKPTCWKWMLGKIEGNCV
jgi:hypothetical protein